MNVINSFNVLVTGMDIVSLYCCYDEIPERGKLEEKGFIFIHCLRKHSLHQCIKYMVVGVSVVMEAFEIWQLTCY